jgi:hypothetical protein
MYYLNFRNIFIGSVEQLVEKEVSAMLYCAYDQKSWDFYDTSSRLKYH